MLNVNWEKIHSIIIICHFSWLKKLCPCSYTSPQNHSWIFETLWVIIFWVRVTHKMLNVNWGKNSLNNIICHLSWLKKLSPTRTDPLISICEFLKPCDLFIFWVRVTHKMVNVNCMKIHSIILSVTCHSLRNFLPLTHIPLYPTHEFLKPYGVEWVIHGWGGVGWGRVGHTGCGWGGSCSKTT